MQETTAFRAVPKPGAGSAFPSAQQQAGAEDSPGVEVPTRLLASRANEQEIARVVARKGSQHEAEERIILLELSRFQSSHNHFQRTGRVDLDARSLFDYAGRAPPDQYAQRPIVEDPPHGCCGQTRDAFEVGAQTTCETLVPSAWRMPASAASDTCFGPFKAPDGSSKSGRRICRTGGASHHQLPVLPAQAAAFPVS